MERWEVRNSIGNKLDRLHGNISKTEEQKDSLGSQYKSYKEAQEARDTKAMIGIKLDKLHSSNRSVIGLSNEYYSSMSINQIMKEEKKAKKRVEEAKEVRDHLYEKEYKRKKAEFIKIGGVTGDVLEGRVLEYMDTYNDETYTKAVEEYKDAKNHYTAIKNAKDMYIEDHKDLIEAEKMKAQREELLSSGILEEMGIAPSDE